MERGVEFTGADQRPERVHPGFPRGLFVEHERLRPGTGLGMGPLDQQPLRDIAEIDVGTLEPLNQLRIGLLGQVESRSTRPVLVANAVEPPLEAIDALRIASGVLIAVVAIVPVENVEAAIGAGLLRDRHEPGVVGGEKVGAWFRLVGRPMSFQGVDVDGVPVNIPHVEMFAELGRIGVAVEEVDPAVRRLLMLVVDDRAELPGEGGYSPP